MTGAQQPPKPWRIGILHPGRHPGSEAIASAPFPAGMRDLGYIEGRDVLYERRFADGRLELLHRSLPN
jgi:hypothetical protein